MPQTGITRLVANRIQLFFIVPIVLPEFGPKVRDPLLLFSSGLRDDIGGIG